MSYPFHYITPLLMMQRQINFSGQEQREQKLRMNDPILNFHLTITWRTNQSGGNTDESTSCSE